MKDVYKAVIQSHPPDAGLTCPEPTIDQGKWDPEGRPDPSDGRLVPRRMTADDLLTYEAIRKKQHESFCANKDWWYSRRTRSTASA
jgi:hypothetical protein